MFRLNGSFLIVLLCLSCTLCSAAHTRRQSPTSYYNGTTAARDGLLERINDRITALTTLDEQQLKRLEALEYKLTRIEVTDQERIDALRSDVKDMTTRVQNLDWLSSKSESTLDQVKNEMEAVRHSIDSYGPRLSSQVQAPTEPDCSDKLTAISILLTSTRGAVFNLDKELQNLSKNLSNVLAIARDIRQHENTLPTKQYLNSALHSLRNQPVYAVMQNHPNSPYGRSSSMPTSCSHLNTLKSGIEKIQVGALKEPFFVMCDGETDEGGWTVIQHRKDGTVNFNRNWLEYKFGFGNIAGEFFIGLDKLHEMTTSTLHELLIVLEDFEGETKQAKYKNFGIGGEKEDYALNLLGEYEGTAGDSLSYSAAYKFSTFDNDNDGWVEGNCALAHTGAWWFNACEMSNLNGQYLSGELASERQFQGIYWNEFHGPKYSLKSVKMMIRPVDRIFTADIN